MVKRTKTKQPVNAFLYTHTSYFIEMKRKKLRKKTKGTTTKMSQIAECDDVLLESIVAAKQKENLWHKRGKE